VNLQGSFVVVDLEPISRGFRPCEMSRTGFVHHHYSVGW